MFVPSAEVKEGHGNSWAFDMEIHFSLKVKRLAKMAVSSNVHSAALKSAGTFRM